MNYSTIADIAATTNKSTDSLLADIKSLFGDEFPEVHNWTADTQLPDDKITYQILSFYGVKDEIENNKLSAQVPTTLPDLIKSAAPLQRVALQQSLEAMEVSFADYFGVQITKSALNAYFAATESAYSLINEILEADVRAMNQGTQTAYSDIEALLKQHYKNGTDTLGNAVRLKKVVGETSKFQATLQAMRSSLNN